MTVRAIFLAAALVAAAAQGAAPAPGPETVFVAPRQTLPLLAQPMLGAPTGVTVATGDPLSVIGQQADFLQVRTDAGATGWIRRSNTVAESPAAPPDLVAENTRLTEQARTLDAQVRAFQDENAQLHARMQALEVELAAQTRPVPLTPEGVFAFLLRLAADPSAWVALGVLALALLLAFRAGVQHRNRAIRERFGGLDL